MPRFFTRFCQWLYGLPAAGAPHPVTPPGPKPLNLGGGWRLVPSRTLLVAVGSAVPPVQPTPLGTLVAEELVIGPAPVPMTLWFLKGPNRNLTWPTLETAVAPLYLRLLHLPPVN